MKTKEQKTNGSPAKARGEQERIALGGVKNEANSNTHWDGTFKSIQLGMARAFRDLEVDYRNLLRWAGDDERVAGRVRVILGAILDEIELEHLMHPPGHCPRGTKMRVFPSRKGHRDREPYTT